MSLLEVFDPPMCCSTGICGPEPDPALIQFSVDLSWLEEQNVEVRRHNLAQDPQSFASCSAVQRLLSRVGQDDLDTVLPALVVDGQLIGQGYYPSRSELAQLFGLPDHGALPAAGAEGESLVTPAVAELIALSAAVAASCETCFKYHYAEARKLGVSKEDMLRAAETGLEVKRAPNDAVIALARKLLLDDLLPVTGNGSCCAGKGCC